MFLLYLLLGGGSSYSILFMEKRSHCLSPHDDLLLFIKDSQTFKWCKMSFSNPCRPLQLEGPAVCVSKERILHKCLRSNSSPP